MNDFFGNTLDVSINLSKPQLSELFHMKSKSWGPQLAAAVQYMMRGPFTFSSGCYIGTVRATGKVGPETGCPSARSWGPR